jgi:hypothetical protein
MNEYDLKKYILSKFPNIFLAPVDELELTVRTSNCLRAQSLFTIGDVVQKQKYELLCIPNLGKKSMEELEEALARVDLKLGMTLKNFPPSDLDVVGLDEHAIPVTREKLIRAMRIAAHRLVINCEVDDPAKSIDYAKLIEQLHRLLKEGEK